MKPAYWLCCALLPFAALADEPPPLMTALSGGKPSLDMRLRYEGVDQDNALDIAHAFTVRTRLGYTTAPWHSLDAFVEMENLSDLSDDAYNSTLNGQTTRSVVADPEGTELNQAFLRYAGIPGTSAKLGRQRIVWDGGRMVGNIGWRQNEMTYDAALLSNTLIPKTTLNYAYLANINSIVFSDFDVRGHLLNVRYVPLDALALTAYAYRLDFEIDPAAPPATAARRDSQTLGLRASGKATLGLLLSYGAEFAKQSDVADSLDAVDASYTQAELGATLGPVTATLDYQRLSGDGAYGFQTPLASIHAFLGWGDLFLTTPNIGIRKPSLKLSGVVQGVTLVGAFHRFEADAGSATLGDELDLLASYSPLPPLTLSLKYADYRADTFSVDTRKSWAFLEYKF